jgi:predicted nucleic acid-binding protein
MKKILIDSGPLIALFDASDKHHARATNFIKNKNSLLITTIVSITETFRSLRDTLNLQCLRMSAWVCGQL